MDGIKVDVDALTPTEVRNVSAIVNVKKPEEEENY
jgi:hypothetical protein